MGSQTEVAADVAPKIAEGEAHFALPTRVRPRVMRPRLLLQAIITKERGEVRELDVKRALTPALRRLLSKWIRTRLLEDATWVSLCNLIGETYDGEGWSHDILARERQGTDDDGAGCDLLLTRKGFGSIQFIDQREVCAHRRIVEVEEIGGLLDALETLPAGSKARGIVSTTTDFAESLRDHPRVRALIPAHLALRNCRDLLAWMKEAATTY